MLKDASLTDRIKALELEAAQLREGLSHRAVIEQAIGMIMITFLAAPRLPGKRSRPVPSAPTKGFDTSPSRSASRQPMKNSGRAILSAFFPVLAV
jgi:hypothetical protein